MGSQSSQSQNSGTYNQYIPGFQSSALTNLYSAAQGLFGTTNSATQAAIPGAQNIVSGAANSAATANQGNLQGGAYA